MKTGAMICLGLFVVAALLVLLQLWLTLFSAELFTKLLITLGILFVVTLGVALVRREFAEEKKMKDGGYID